MSQPCGKSWTFTFGNDFSGQLGVEDSNWRNVPAPIVTSGVLQGLSITSISSFRAHSLILSANGTVFSFGNNFDGQLGDNTPFNRDYPVAVSTSGVLNGKTITAAAAGAYHSLVLSSNGQVFSFGRNVYGQLGDGTVIERKLPVAVSTSGVLSGKIITAIAAGSQHSLVLSSTGQVFSFGYNYYGQLGDGTIMNSYTPVAVSKSGVLNGTTITAIAAGGSHSLVLSSTGQVFSFGYNNNGQLGDGTNTNRYIPVAVSTSGVLNNVIITAIAAGGLHSLVLSSTGQVFSFGRNVYGQLGDGTNTDRNLPVAVSTSGMLNNVNITAVAAGGYHSLVLSSTGQVFSFGYNNNGQLGDGTNTDRNIPVAVSTSGGLNNFNITAIAAGESFSLVLSSTGQVFSFGYNNYGQLGDRETLLSFVRLNPVSMAAVDILTGHEIAAISAGESFSLVLSETGQVFSFGLNNYGQLGDGTDITRYIPVAVNNSGVLTGTNITAIAAGEYHSLVLSSTGQVFSFGRNGWGQLGDGTNTYRKLPVAVSTSGVLNNVNITAIAAGGDHSLVLSSTGQVFSFGWNTYGQLGDGITSSFRNIPVAVNTSGVLSGLNITAIAAGGDHSLVLSSTGQVFSFGRNDNGQLGDYSNTNRNVPVAVNTSGVLSGLNITAIAAGRDHSIVLSSTGQVFSFGINNGRLGDGTTTNRNIPVAVNNSGVLSGLNVTAIAAGGDHSIVLTSVVSNITSGKVWDGSTTTGEQLLFQHTTNMVTANWEAFLLKYANGYSRAVKSYSVTTFEKKSGTVVMGPRTITFPFERPFYSFEIVPDVELSHNVTYFTTISNTGYCFGISESSVGFLVDTTPPNIGTMNVTSNLWRIDGNLTLECETSDPESGISLIEISIVDASTNIIVSPSDCHMILHETQRQFEFSWSECGVHLPPTIHLKFSISAMNGANSISTMISSSEFQVTGIRITSLMSWDGSNSALRQCRRATVKWTSIGLDGSGVVLYLVGVGNPEETINITQSSIPIETTQFEWTPVPSSVTPRQYQIKIAALLSSNPIAFGTSETFTIEASDACITISSPNGSSTWVASERVRIKWDATGNGLHDNLTLSLMLNGVQVEPIGPANGSIAVSAGAFDWTIPSNIQPGMGYQVRAETVEVQGVVSVTDSFEIRSSDDGGSTGDGNSTIGGESTIGGGFPSTPELRMWIGTIAAVSILGLTLLVL